MPKNEILKYVSSLELCNFLGVSQQTISNYVKKGMPKEPDGRYKFKDCLDWYYQKEFSKKSVKFVSVDRVADLLCLTERLGGSSNIYHEAEGGTGNAVFISTLIDATRVVHKIQIQIADEWDLTGAGDFKYVKKSGTSNLPFWCAPVEPSLKDDASGKEWQSNQKKVDGTPIATYTKKSAIIMAKRKK